MLCGWGGIEGLVKAARVYSFKVMQKAMASAEKSDISGRAFFNQKTKNVRQHDKAQAVAGFMRSLVKGFLECSHIIWWRGVGAKSCQPFFWAEGLLRWINGFGSDVLLERGR